MSSKKNKHKNIEDVYPLSPMQQGMLFHSLFTPASGVYITQESYELHGNLDVSAFEQAWQHVVDRHPILRTAFVWKNIEKPLQVVGRHVKLPLDQHDWRRLSPIEQQKQLEAFLKADRHRDFELSKAPLMRLTLIQLSSDTYQFIWSHHHLLLDGWSLLLLLKEVLAFYEAFRLGQVIHLERPRAYRDYISWLQQQDISQAKEFWQQQLKGFTAPTSLIVDWPAHSLVSQDQSYAEQQIQLSAPDTAALQSLARQHKLTLNTLVQGVWALLLSRYSRQEDIVFGSTSSGRPPTLVGAESMIGLFINTLPIRVQVNVEEYILPWLSQLQARQIESLEYEYSPLVEIQGWSEVTRGVPLFESIIVSQEYQVDSSLQERNGNLAIHKVNSTTTGTNYPLTVLVELHPEFSLRILYDNHRFGAATIARMLEHLRTMLTSIVAHPDQRLSDLPLLTEAERYKQLLEWNDTHAEYQQNQCIHQLFEAQVERSPDAIAVVFENYHLTYRELNAKANRIAHHLRTLGVGPEVLVGICVERSLLMVVGLLGILKAGGAYLPLDPAYPSERLALMLSSQVSVLLTQEKLVAGLPEIGAHVVCLDKDWAVIAQKSEENPINCAIPENLAYVIYTSGSTGKPKGVLIQHRSLVNYTEAVIVEYKISKRDRILQFASISFDVAAEEIFPSLVQGATLILRTDEMLSSIPAFLKICRDWQLTVLNLPTAFWHQMVAELSATSLVLPESVRLAIVGGETALPERLATWQQVSRSVRLVNNYGPTEATIGTTTCELSAIETLGQKLPIGKAINNAQTYILDPYLQLTPVGVPGELYIGGVGVARGYLNRPELTAERFVPNPFSEELGSRLYKTGDLVRYRADGNIEFLGRIDNQVKIRGFRIELGEIEAVLSQHPGVRETVVVVREDEPSSKRLVAYAVLQPEQTISITDLRHFLEEKLPNYMVPTVFAVLESLPLLPNGKVDRRSLPAPDTVRPELEKPFVAPRTSVEVRLAHIWAKVLGVERVGIYDNFFELGGDSILTIQVVSKANQAGLQLTPKQLFQHQNIADLAAVAIKTQGIQAEQGLVAGPVPLTPIQQLFFEQNLPPHHFNQAVLLEVREVLDLSLLEQAIQQLLLHHDSLRLRFERADSGWQQLLVSPDEVVPFTRLDFSALTEKDQGLAIETTATELQASLNLSAGPLVQVAFFDLGVHQPSRLLVIIHHLVVDGVSWRILLEDLQTAYQQLSQGRGVQLPAKTTSFKYWSQQLRQYAKSVALKQEWDYWLSQSRKYGDRLPVDYPEGDNTVASTEKVSISLSVEETQALLQEVPKAYNTQINDILLSALVQAFAKWTGDRSLLVDLEGHGREDIFDNVDLSRTVGWFTTVFPVLLNTEGTFGSGNALKAVKEQLRGVPNRGIGYGVLRYLSDEKEIAEKLGTMAQAEVIFNYLGQFDQAISQSSLFGFAQESSGATQAQRGYRSHLLEIDGLVSRGQLRLNWTYSKNLYRRATVESLVQSFMEALRSLIAHCQSPEAGGYTPSDFPLAKLEQQRLDELIAKEQQVEDIYPLSPLQQGLLFETVSAFNSGIYVSQSSCNLHGNLNISALKQSWQLVVDRHSIFRTAFVWENLEQPLQIVYQQVQLPWQQYDWQELSPVEQSARLETLLQADQVQGFILSQAPLMRVTLIQVAEDTYQFIWSSHHLLLDGWSVPLVLKEVFTAYEVFCLGKNIHLAPTRPYRDYISWLQQQNLSQAEAFWRQLLKGFTAPTPLGMNQTTGKGAEQEGSYDIQTIQLSAATTAALQSLAQQHQLTLNTIIQGAWALLLNYYSGEKDVVFGATSSGRPTDMTGAEFMVGLFINTLPVRVQVSLNELLLPWLKQIQAQQVEARQYEYSPLAQIQKWSDVPQGVSLFKSIVVFENQPVDSSLQKQNNLEISNARFVISNGYPLTLRGIPKTELSLEIMYNCCCFDTATIAQRLGHLETLLSKIVIKPNASLSELAEILAAADKQQKLIKERELEEASRQNFKMTKRKAIRGS